MVELLIAVFFIFFSISNEYIDKIEPTNGTKINIICR